MKKTISVLLALLFAAVLFTGCGKQTDTQTTTESGETVYGKVTAVDGNSVTLELGTMPENKNDGQGEIPSGEMPTGENGQVPSAPDGQGNPPEKPSGEQSSGEQPTGDIPEMPSGENGEVPEKSSGDMSSGGFGQGGEFGFTSTGETKTINLEGVSVSVGMGNNETQGSISDIAVGTVLQLIYDADGNLSGVTVFDFGGMSDIVPENGSAPSATETTETTESTTAY